MLTLRVDAGRSGQGDRPRRGERRRRCASSSRRPPRRRGAAPRSRLPTESGGEPPILVGSIARAHGLGGEVVVDPYSDVARALRSRAASLTAAFPSGRQRAVVVVGHRRPFQERLLVRFEGVAIAAGRGGAPRRRPHDRAQRGRSRSRGPALPLRAGRARGPDAATGELLGERDGRLRDREQRRLRGKRRHGRDPASALASVVVSCGRSTALGVR